MKKFLLFALIASMPIGQIMAADKTDPEDEVTFRTDGILYLVNAENQTTVTVIRPSDPYSETDMSIPESVTDATSGQTYTVTGIGPEAFMSAKTVTITIPPTITDIAGNAFFSAYSLKEIIADEDNPVFKTDNGVLYSKNMDKLVTFPTDKEAASFALPESVTELGDYAFCGVWLTAFEIPARITKIGYGAFMGTQLKKMTVPASVKELRGGAFQNCTRLESIEFQNEMEVFPNHTLTYCNMLQKIVLPDNISVIGDYAFDGTFIYGSAYGLIGEFTCPETLRTIGIGAFNGNHGLKKVTLNATLEVINLYAFSNCTKLSEIVSLNPSVPACIDEAGMNDVLYCFNGVPETCVLYVPEASVDAYRSEWGAKFSDIRPIETGSIDIAASVAYDTTITVSNGLLEISSSSPVEVFTATGACVAQSGSGLLQITPGKGCYIVRTGAKSVKVIL